MASLPLEVTASAKQALGDLASSESAPKALFYSFSLDAQTQALSCDEHKMSSLADVATYTKQVCGDVFDICNFGNARSVIIT